MRRNGASSQILTVVFGLVVALAVVEVALQIAAAAVWLRARGGEDDADVRPEGARVVLCVGDSFTYGSGASSPDLAYPGQLQRTLAESSPEHTWIVRNGGWPGRNSTELARRLPSLLERERPDYVCVLVGLNNLWNPEEMGEALPAIGAAADEGDPRAWAWRWRTLRLLRIARNAYRQRAAGVRSAPEMAPGGEIVVDSDDPVAALDAVRSRLGAASDVAALHRTVDEARPIVLSRDVPSEVANLVLLLGEMSRYEDAIDEGLRAIERHGRTAELAHALVRSLARRGRTDEALELGRIAVAAAPDDPKPLRELGTALRMARHPEESFRAHTKVFVLNGDFVDLERQYRKVLRRWGPPMRQVDPILEEIVPDDASRRRVAELYARILAGRTETARRDELVRDLIYIAEAVESAGATPVVVTYPRPLTNLGDRIREAAEESNALLVDLQPVFDEILRSSPYDAYFIPDGHCNDRGYTVLAREVADAILSAED